MPDKLRAVFRQGAFARYMAGEAVSMTGTWMQVMAQNWVMTSLTASAAMFGLVNFAVGIPMLALSMVGGVAADRFDRRHILLTTQVVQIALALLIGWLVAVERIAVWHILAVAFVLGVSNSFEWPAAAALVPELVPREHIATAIAIDRSVFHGTRLIGPALAGYVIGLSSSAMAFFLNALSFVAFIVALMGIQPRAQGPPEEQAQRRTGIKAGLAHVRSDKPTLGMVALMAATTAFVFPVVVVMMPLYATKVLGLGPDKMGLLMAISSIGSLSGSASLLAVPANKRRRLMVVAVIGVAAALMSLSQARAFAVAAASLAVSSLGTSTLLGLANTVVQERAPGPLRGRVSAVAGYSFFGLMPFTSLGLTSLADSIGKRETLGVAAALYLVTGVAVLLLSRRRPGDGSQAPKPET